MDLRLSEACAEFAPDGANNISASRRSLLMALGLSLGVGGIPLARAANPISEARPLKLTIGYAAGTGPDFFVRAFSPSLAPGWPGGVVIDNRPGAGGGLGVAAVGAAPPDGATLLFAVVGEIAIWPHFHKKMAFDPAALVPVCQITDSSLQLSTGSDSGVRSIPDLLRLTKDQPSLLVGTFGMGSPHHLAAMLMGDVLKRKIEAVHYNTPGSMLADLSAGRINVGFTGSTLALTWLRTGKVRLLGTSTQQRPELLSDVPTFEEIGLKGAEVNMWGGIFAPPGTSPDLVSQLEKTILEAASDPNYAAQLEKVGVTVKPGRTAAFSKLVASDRDRYGEIVSRLGLKIS